MRPAPVLAALLVALPAMAAEQAVLDRFMAATETFNQKAERAGTPDRPAGQMRAEGDCILDRMQAAGGDDAVGSLIVMVETLNAGGHVGSPEVVEFRESWGETYMGAVGTCATPPAAQE